MYQFRFLRSVLLMIVLAAFSMPSASIVAAKSEETQGIHLTHIGHPTWKPVDIHLFAAQIGTAADGYAEFYPQLGYILPPPYHLFNPAIGGIGPGAPHQPPYNTEMAKGLAKLGYHQGVEFRRSEFSNGMGVYIVWMTVPDPGVTGSSPDFASGSIIPNALFPITISGVSYHNNKVFDAYLAPTFGVPDIIAWGFNKDGHSHFPDIIADNADFGPAGAKLNGSFVYAIDEIDASGNGWHIDAHFAVGD
jgi:hypothetical protein